MIPKVIFFNPCSNCLVQPCCSQICLKKKEYNKYQGAFQQAAESYVKNVLKTYEENSIFRILGKTKK